MQFKKKETHKMTDLLDIITAAFAPVITSSKTLPKVFARTYCPPITKVIDNNPTTVVMFNDGSKSVVKCSSNDTYNLETAILYAIVKRTFGKVDPATSEASCPGLGNNLKKILDELAVSAKDKQTAPCPKCYMKKASKPKATCDWFEPLHKKTSKIAAKLNGTAKAAVDYVRPNKPFSKFTQDEKRAYWRWQNAKRRSR